MIDYYIFFLKFFELDLYDRSFERILSAIGNAIGDCEENIRKANSTGDEYYTWAVTDDEVDVVENLLGTAYVFCQTYITKTVSDVKALHCHHNKSNPSSMLKTTADSKESIVCFGSDRIPPGYTKVQVIDAFANYFKHGDEWGPDWSKLPKQSEKTAEVMSAAGAASGSTGNLRQGSRVLGNKDFKNTILFHDIIKSWRTELYVSYKAELQNLGLISPSADL